MRLLGEFSFFFIIPIIVVLALFSIQLIVLRIREINAVVKDPHVGRKTILYFFYNICVFMLLGSLTVSIADYMEYVFEPLVEAQQAKQAKQNVILPPPVQAFAVDPVPNPLTDPITRPDGIPPQNVPIPPPLNPEPLPGPRIPLPSPRMPRPDGIPPEVPAPPLNPEPRVPVIELTEEEQKAIAVRAPYDWKSDTQRLCAGLILSGLLHALFFKAIALIFTNDWRFPAARRAAAGIRLVVAGLIVLSLSTVMIVGMFQKGETDYKMLRVVCSLAVVWGPMFLIHAVVIILFQRKLPNAVAPSET